MKRWLTPCAWLEELPIVVIDGYRHVQFLAEGEVMTKLIARVFYTRKFQ